MALEEVEDALPALSAVYRAYVELMRLERRELGGWLLLATPGTDADALVRAASVAGAATLRVEADPVRARALVREGVCDFLVTTLSEGLRILKNEVRQRRVVAVCVLGEPEALVAECVERGVQPELLSMEAPELVKRGARVVRGGAAPKGESLVHWTAEPASGQALAWVEKLAIESLNGGEGRAAKLRWLAGAAQYLGRSLTAGRSVGMSAGERQRFLASVARAVAGGELPARLLVRTIEAVGSLGDSGA